MPAAARLSPSKVTFRLAPDVRQSPDGHKDVKGLPRSEVNRPVSSLKTSALEWVSVLAPEWVLASVLESEWVLVSE
jgi:hypothetical protein